MEVKLADSAVPFVVTYRKYLRTPKMKITRRFVGPAQLVKNIIGLVAHVVDDLCFIEEREVTDPGKSVAVHWAIQVEDPWDAEPGREANLIAHRMIGDRPPCGAHFEIITPVREQEGGEEMSPEEFSAQRSATNGNGWQRPAHAAYGPRRVKPLDPVSPTALISPQQVLTEEDMTQPEEDL